MRTLSPEGEAELTYRLNEFGKTASSALQISNESDRIRREIEMREQIAQMQEKRSQEMLNIQKQIAQSAKRQVDISESSAQTMKRTAWISRGGVVINLMPMIMGFLRKLWNSL